MAVSTIKTPVLETKEVVANISTVSANTIQTFTIDISSNPAYNKLIKGFLIGNTPELVIEQLYCASQTSIAVRVRNLTSSQISGATILVYYC